jgi:hypothetical protein
VIVLDEGRCEDFGSLGVEARNGETATAGGGRVEAGVKRTAEARAMRMQGPCPC